jgi:hypothetical protein
VSSFLPDPAPLDPPAGSPDAVEDAAQASSLAARLLDELTGGVTAAGAPGWQGRDAEAAEDRRLRIARLGADAAEALHRVALRLGAHADVLREVAARTSVLRAAQDEQFAVARDRIALPFDPEQPLAAPPEDVVAALATAEADRAAEHARLIARVDDDAGDTVRVLSAAAALVAGAPRYDPAVALLHLAELLPAWGTPEIARRGYLLALAVRGRRGEDGLNTAELQAAATEDLDLAGDPAYAAAFLEALGPALATGWLQTGWSGAAADDPCTELFARVLSGLDRDTSGPAWLPGLLDGASGDFPMAAGGVGAVLARAAALGLSGPPPAVAAAWFGSLVRDEKANGRQTDLGVAPADADPAASDPLALLADAMGDQRAAVQAALAMSDPDAWSVLLSRFWNDDAVRDSLITTVAGAPAEVAVPALGSSLVALGTGLADGDPDDWPLYLLEERLKGVAPVLTSALLRHPDVLVRPLADVSVGRADAGSVTALRGLAVTVAVDEGTTGDEERGLAGDRIAAALARPHPVSLPAGATAAGVAGAFVAVREHGARLAHAMSQHVLRDEAEAGRVIYRSTIGLPFTVTALIPSTSLAAVVADTGVSHVLGADGSWHNTPDVQRHHPVTAAEAAVPDAARAHARQGYGDTLETLGTPVVPQAPPSAGLVEKETDAVVHELLGGWIGKRLRLREPVGGIVGGVLVGGLEDLLGPD